MQGMPSLTPQNPPPARLEPGARQPGPDGGVPRAPVGSRATAEPSPRRHCAFHVTAPACLGATRSPHTPERPGRAIFLNTPRLHVSMFTNRCGAVSAVEQRSGSVQGSVRQRSGGRAACWPRQPGQAGPCRRQRTPPVHRRRPPRPRRHGSAARPAEASRSRRRPARAPSTLAAWVETRPWRVGRRGCPGAGPRHGAGPRARARGGLLAQPRPHPSGPPPPRGAGVPEVVVGLPAVPVGESLGLGAERGETAVQPPLPPRAHAIRLAQGGAPPPLPPPKHTHTSFWLPTCAGMASCSWPMPPPTTMGSSKLYRV